MKEKERDGTKERKAIQFHCCNFALSNIMILIITYLAHTRVLRIFWVYQDAMWLIWITGQILVKFVVFIRRNLFHCILYHSYETFMSVVTGLRAGYKVLTHRFYLVQTLMRIKMHFITIRSIVLNLLASMYSVCESKYNLYRIHQKMKVGNKYNLFIIMRTVHYRH